MDEPNRWYTVGEVGSLTGVTRKTLFYYDRTGLLSPSDRRGPQNHKVYDAEALERLGRIQRFRAAGLRIEEVKLALNAQDEEMTALLEKVYARLLREKEEKKEQISSLLELYRELKGE